MKTKREVKEIDIFAQIPKLETPQYVLNKQKNRLDFVEMRNDIKYVNDNKNLTFKELIEKYGLVNVLKNQDRGINLDQTLIYNDINTMWNDGQQYQKQQKQQKAAEPTKVEQAAEEIKNIELNKEVNNNEQQ